MPAPRRLCQTQMPGGRGAPAHAPGLEATSCFCMVPNPPWLGMRFDWSTAVASSPSPASRLLPFAPRPFCFLLPCA
eukprot:9468450-Pyramimonas_sp.AAC.1